MSKNLQEPRAKREKEHTDFVAGLGCHDFRFWFVEILFIQNHWKFALFIEGHQYAKALYTRNRTCDCLEGKNREGIKMQEEKRTKGFMLILMGEKRRI